MCHCFWSLRRERVGCFWCWGGIQKSLLMVRSDVEIENENLPFLYKLVGTWAFSPHPKYDQINKIDNFKERLFPHDMVLFFQKSILRRRKIEDHHHICFKTVAFLSHLVQIPRLGHVWPVSTSSDLTHSAFSGSSYKMMSGAVQHLIFGERCAPW